MPATFDPGQFDPISRVRYGVADTDTSDALLDDAYYETALRLMDNDIGQAIRYVADHLATKIAQDPDKVGDLSWSKRIDRWREIAAGTAGGATLDQPVGGGTSGSGGARVGRLTAGSDFRVR